MSKANGFIKFIGYVFIYLVTAIQSYIISMTAMSVLMTLFCTVWNIIAPLPQQIAEHYAIYFLLSSVPLAVVVFIYTVVVVNGKEKKSKDNKQNDNNK